MRGANDLWALRWTLVYKNATEMESSSIEEQKIQKDNSYEVQDVLTRSNLHHELSGHA